ncbi:hypothetical protein F7725_021311 [Dissostichus mawsoni]|uniref:Uncharacterized protein n=1 Tax=Dissostichus mawsoni TaxID=36200 RepID=A0A7J5YGL7_DISMA|nr:hypothetical protein F7725_021311 [Dissostichus mawsoni]
MSGSSSSFVAENLQPNIDDQLCGGIIRSAGETLRPAEEPETLRRDSQTCRGTRDTEERLSDLQRNQRR